jgi:hypothetical protein
MPRKVVGAALAGSLIQSELLSLGEGRPAPTSTPRKKSDRGVVEATACPSSIFLHGVKKSVIAAPSPPAHPAARLCALWLVQLAAIFNGCVNLVETQMSVSSSW